MKDVPKENAVVPAGELSADANAPAESKPLPEGAQPAIAGAAAPAGDAKTESERERLLAGADRVSQSLLDKMPKSDRDAGEAMLSNPRLMDVIQEDSKALGVVRECNLAVTVYILGTSRLLNKPVAAIVQGPSSTGKSFIPNRVGQLFPGEAVLRATDITKNALYYMPPGSLIHRLVIAGERRRGKEDEGAEATRALREMIESGNLSKLVTGQPKDRFQTILVEQYGPIAFIESTTESQIFDEDRNRCLLLATDETPEQTAAVVEAQGAHAEHPRSGVKEIIARHHAAQRMLKRVEVVVPFARAIAAAVPTQRHEARRAMPMILVMVQAVALLHQRQRAPGEVRHGDRITATLDDYAIVRDLLVEPLARALGWALPKAVMRFYQRLLEKFGTGPAYSSTDALNAKLGLASKGKVNEYLRELDELGFVELFQMSNGGIPAKYINKGPMPTGGGDWLPTVEQLRGDA